MSLMTASNNPKAEPVALVVDGTEWRGWTDVTIERYIDAVDGAFRLDLTAKWPELTEPRPIGPGMSTELIVGDETVLTGWIEDVEPYYDRQSHGISVSGFDLTHRLVTYSAIPRQYDGLSLFDLVSQIASPFGVTVAVGTPMGATISRFVVEDGESSFDAIERACRLRGVLPLTDGAGQLILSRAGELGSTAAVRGGWGGNVEAARGRFTQRDRAREYIVKGQRPRRDEDESESDAAHIVATAVDEAVAGYAPLIIIASDPLDLAAAQLRADWERSVRRGRSRRAMPVVSGWRDADGALWQVNTRVPYSDSMLGIDAELLVVGVQLQQSDAGTTAALTLADPAAYTPDPSGEIEIGWGGDVPPKPVARPKW